MVDDLRALIFQTGAEKTLAVTGWSGLVASSRGLRLLGLPVCSEAAAFEYIRQCYQDVSMAPDDLFLQQVARQVLSYLAGERREFDVELDLRGHTPFALSVWAAAARIAYGETRTYGWIADQVGGPGAAQAVGAALGANPVPLIVPCHRVLGSDGSLHGFAGGLEMKARLLAMESGQWALALE
jgi:O-6-methylguanine DNA methyltransferase